MTATTAHTFTASTEDRRRCTCGKTRNTAAHGYNAKARATAKTETVQEQADRIQGADGQPEVVSTRMLTAAEQCGIFGCQMVAGTCEICGRPDPAAMPSNADVEALLDEVEARADAEKAARDEYDRLQDELAAEHAQVENDAAAEHAAALAQAEVVELAADHPANAGVVRVLDERVVPVKVKVKAKPAPAVTGEPVRSLWVAAAFVPVILTDTTPERATLVAKLDASIPNKQGGRTVRLTRAEAQELSAIGTEIENEAVGSGAKGAGRMAHSARTMRDRLAALWV